MRTPGIGDLTGYDLQVERIIQRYLDKRVPALRQDINNDIQNAVRTGVSVPPAVLPGDDDPAELGASPDPGADNAYARIDHVHPGPMMQQAGTDKGAAHTVNVKHGTVTVAGGVADVDLPYASSTPADVGNAGQVGSSTDVARADHTHKLTTGTDDYLTVGFVSGSLEHSFKGVKVLADGIDVGQRPKLNFSGAEVDDDSSNGTINVSIDTTSIGGGGQSEGGDTAVAQSKSATFAPPSPTSDDYTYLSVTIPPNSVIRKVGIRLTPSSYTGPGRISTTKVYFGAINPGNLVWTVNTASRSSGATTTQTRTITPPAGDAPSGITVNAELFLGGFWWDRLGTRELVVDYDLMISGMGTPIQVSQDKVLGRKSAGTGDAEEIDCTPMARSLLDDSSASVMRTTLGLGTSDKPTFGGLTLPATTLVYPMYAKYGAPTSGTYTTGAIAIDLGGATFICTSGGTPGTWLQITNAKIATANWSTFNNTANWNGSAFRDGYYADEQGVTTWIRRNSNSVWIEPVVMSMPLAPSPVPAYKAPFSANVARWFLDDSYDYFVSKVYYNMGAGAGTNASNYWITYIIIGGSGGGGISNYKLDSDDYIQSQPTVSSYVYTASQHLYATVESVGSPPHLAIFQLGATIARVRK